MLGCVSGFLWVLIGFNMIGWLKDVGFSCVVIGYFGSVFVVYVINFFWVLLVDRVKLFILYLMFG